MPLRRISLVKKANLFKNVLNKDNESVRLTSTRFAILVLTLWVAFLTFELQHVYSFFVTEETEKFVIAEDFWLPQNPLLVPTDNITHSLKGTSLEGQNQLKFTQPSNQSESMTNSVELQLSKLSIQNATKIIFYHAYLPLGNPTSSKNALRIVKEQIEQMGNKGVTLLYNTVGDPNSLSIDKMNQWCQKHKFLACHHLKHHESASEEVSLQNIHQFCQKWPNQRVGYVHNKGSFHPSLYNEIWRYLMTEALMKEECWNSDNDNQSCNACGLFFSHEVGAHFSGNVWSAECSYINKLIPPQDFDKKSIDAYKDALLRIELGQFKMSLTAFNFSECICWAGIGRYAAEFWIGSHPAIRPCDFSKVLNYDRKEETHERKETSRFFDWLPGLSQSSQIEGGKNKETSALKLFWRWMRDHQRQSRRMQRQLLSDNFTPKAPSLPHRKLDPHYRNLREYYSLGGRIHRWLYLYGQLPDQDSWAWTSYPNGFKWRQKANQYGLNVLEKVLPIHNDEHREKGSLVSSTFHANNG